MQLKSPISVPQRGLLLIKGQDSYKFLQGQVTCDVRDLSPKKKHSHTALGAHCNTKGRMHFSFRAIGVDAETIALALPLSLVTPALETLKKYSVFSKVVLMDASPDYRCVLLHQSQLDSVAKVFNQLPNDVNACVHESNQFLIQLSEDYFECWIQQHSESEVMSIDKSTDDNGHWDATAIELGLGEVRPETVEKFIPQMLNLQVTANGVSFTKGCYVGQEVVARMQYLGKLKRRMYHVSSNKAGPQTPGSPLYTIENQQAVGHVVLSTPLNQDFLAVLTEQAVEADQLFADADRQHRLTVLPLPYLVSN
ncbi:MAG: folate-binding protein YgfZ [Cellvibrionaceae bacterium]|jgi:folate-binding protein YgfZ